MQRYPEQSSPTPRKPPRGKYHRDNVKTESLFCGRIYIKFYRLFQASSSNLLMSVIKTLDASENNDEREREKLKIEKEFKKSDRKLQELVGKHDTELTKVSNRFNSGIKGRR
jgi:hypothetical protein